MGSLLSSLPQNDAERGRKRRKKRGKKKYPPKRSESSSSSSFSSPSKTHHVRHKKFRQRQSSSSSSIEKNSRRGNVKNKTALYNKIDKGGSSASPVKTKSSHQTDFRYKPSRSTKGFDYHVENKGNDRLVTVELDIPVLTKESKRNVSSYNSPSASTHETRSTKMPTKKEFEEACIKAHSEYRKCHNAKPLARDTKLSSIAQEWANKLAKKGKLEHSNNTGYGENVAYTSKSDPTGLEICKMWYAEIKDYNFKLHGFAGNTGHFTQVVWKGSTHVGIGIATGSKGTFVVANYKPAGNITNPGFFKDNVEKQRSKPLFAERRGRSSSSSSSSDEGSRRRPTPKISSDTKSSKPKPGKTVDTKTEIYTENGVRKKKTITTTTTVTVTPQGTKTATETKTKIETVPDDDKSVTKKLKNLRVRKDSSSSSSSSDSDDDDGGKNVMSSSDKRKFGKDCLERHNELRRRHGAPKLKESKKLQSAAQRHANRMVRQEKLFHTTKKKYGENVAMKMPRPSGSEACDMWYDEKKDYDFPKAAFSGNTGHFTQVVWGNSKEIGVGVASTAQGKTYVACFYDPPGNVRGEFAKNVRRG